jgi:hypothetical protein
LKNKYDAAAVSINTFKIEASFMVSERRCWAGLELEISSDNVNFLLPFECGK